MSFKVGDKVVIKKEYIDLFPIGFFKKIQNQEFFIIRKVDNMYVDWGEGTDYYCLEGVKDRWSEKHFKSYVERDFVPVGSRFEILDL